MDNLLPSFLHYLDYDMKVEHDHRVTQSIVIQPAGSYAACHRSLYLMAVGDALMLHAYALHFFKPFLPQALDHCQ